MKYIPYGKQYLDKSDKQSVLNSITNGMITTGPFVEKLKKHIKKLFKV